MGHAGFARDIASQQVEFASRRDVGDVQLSAKSTCQLGGKCRRLQASFLAANGRMEHHGRVVAIGLLHLLHVLVDDVGILAVGHDGQME